MDVAKLHIGSDSRFQILQMPENRGVAAARNLGLAQGRGRLITFCDGDDLLLRDNLADRVATFLQVTDQDVAGVFCGTRIVDEEATIDELGVGEPWNPGARMVDFVVAGGECPFGLTSVLLRVDVLRAIGGFDEGELEAEDWECWYRMMRSGFLFVASETRSVAYRQKWASKSQMRAVQHVESSQRLIRSAHASADLSKTKSLATFPFPHALAHYQGMLTMTARTVQYAATTLLRGDLESFRSIIEYLEPGSQPLVVRHIDLPSKILDGFRRAAGLHEADVEMLRSDLEPLRDHVELAVLSATA